MKQIRILLFALALCGLSACDNKNKISADSLAEAESTTADKDSLDSLRQQQIQDAIQQAEQAKQAEQANSKEAIYNAYLQILQRNYRYNDDFCVAGYFLMDFTGNGTPELITKTGTCEADYELDIYSFANGAANKIHNTGAGHSSLYRNGNRLIVYSGHMGYYSINELSYSGRVKSRSLGEGEVDPEEDYPDAPGREVSLSQFTDPTALKLALGM